jgi:hypothetical protein
MISFFRFTYYSSPSQNVRFMTLIVFEYAHIYIHIRKKNNVYLLINEWTPTVTVYIKKENRTWFVWIISIDVIHFFPSSLCNHDLLLMWKIDKKWKNISFYRRTQQRLFLSSVRTLDWDVEWSWWICTTGSGGSGFFMLNLLGRGWLFRLICRTRS